MDNGHSYEYTEVSSWSDIEQQVSLQVQKSPWKLTPNNRLFSSVGGYDGQTFLNTAEYYDPDSNQWFMLPPMACSRSKFTVQ